MKRPSSVVPAPIEVCSRALLPEVHTSFIKLQDLGVQEATATLLSVLCICVYVCVCVCNIRLIKFLSTPLYLRYQLPPSSRPLLYPSYTLTPISPLLYTNNRSSPFPLLECRPVTSVLFYPPIFSHAGARSVPSPLHLSALVAAEYANLCREGRGGSGCWTFIYSTLSPIPTSSVFPSPSVSQLYADSNLSLAIHQQPLIPFPASLPSCRHVRTILSP